MSWNVLITARTFDEVGQSARGILESAGCRLILPPKYGPLPAAEMLKLLPEADATLCSPDDYSAAVLKSAEASRLKIISRWGVGYDSIDHAEAARLGIVVAFTPGYLNEAVADFAFALLLSLARRVHEGHAAMASGRWNVIWGVDVFGKTLGIIGCGRIGQAVARRAAGFGMKLLGYDVAPSAEAEKLGIEMVPLDELLANSDFISLHAALTPDNRGLLNETRLRQMKKGSYLINTARGALVDEAALARGLREGWIAGAAVDAFVTEPLPADHPFRGAPNLLLSPHLASFARETGERVTVAAAQAIVDLMQGRRPKMVVNPQVFDSAALRAKVSA